MISKQVTSLPVARNLALPQTLPGSSLRYLPYLKDERHDMQQSNCEIRDGFQVCQDQFVLPSNTMNLDPKTKRVVTICNLFINHRLAVSDISRVLDDQEGTVVSALIRRGLIKDRRHNPGQPPEGIERRIFR